MKQTIIRCVLITAFCLGLAACAGSGPAVRIKSPAQATPAPGPGVELPAVNIQFAAPGPNPEMNKPDAQGQVAGILLGLWHGFISPVTLVISFVNPKVQMYEVHNDGGPYDLGYLLGIIVMIILISSLARRR